MKWMVAAVVVGLLAALMVIYARGVVSGKDPHEVPFMLRGKPAPAFTLKRLDKEEIVSLAQYRGRPVVINFWATWCGPCKLEHPTLEWASQQYGEKIQFLGVVFEDTLENARLYLASNSFSFPQLMDPHSRMSVDYGLAGVPETYFIDANGTIQDKYVGPLDRRTMTERLRRLAPAAMAEVPK
jgi:cytochrome c biogenesis protein CcmG/thiol:disulfide interchange protein DsbE